MDTMYENNDHLFGRRGLVGQYYMLKMKSYQFPVINNIHLPMSSSADLVLITAKKT